jgi:hypothetical protein
MAGKRALAAAVIGFVACCALAAPGPGRAAIGDDPSAPFVFGAVLQAPLDADEGELIRGAGIQSVRLWLPWAQVEAQRGTYDWSETDKQMREIASAGLTALPFLFASPDWAVKEDGYECDDGGCGAYAPVSAWTREAFARFAGLAVRRYGPNGVFWANNPRVPYRPVREWQIWNEENLQSMFRPYANPSAYAEIVRLTAAEIRGEDPSAKVMLGGMFGDRSTGRRMSTQSYLRELYAIPGISASFDDVAVHPYSNNTSGVLKQVQTAHRIVAKRDPGADLWVTELGWASAGDRHTWGLIKSPRGQARMLRRVFGRLKRHAGAFDLRGAYWYAWRDTAPDRAACGWCPAAGLRDVAGDPKPAYGAMRRLATR